jgi:hypothetical protein
LKITRRPLVGLTILTALVLSFAVASLLRDDRPRAVAAAELPAPRPVLPVPDDAAAPVELVLPDASPAPVPVVPAAAQPVQPVASAQPEPAARPEPSGLELPVAPAQSVLSGIVVDGATGAPCEAEVWLSIPGRPSTNFVVQAPGGAFEQRIEQPGTYVLLARCGGKVGVLGDVPVGAGARTEGLVLTLHEAARVRVADVVRGEGDEASVPWTCTLFRDDAPIGVIVGSTEAELAVPAGTLTARLLEPGTGRRAERSVTASAGELSVIRFD